MFIILDELFKFWIFVYFRKIYGILYSLRKNIYGILKLDLLSVYVKWVVRDNNYMMMLKE